MYFFAAEFFSWFLAVGAAIKAGCLVALALICSIQYGLQMYYVCRNRRRTQHFQSEISHLAAERDDIRNDRLMTQWENQILREFVSASDVNKAGDLLLKHLAPNTSRDFAVLLRLEGLQFEIERSRGLSKASCGNWSLALGDLQELHQEEAVVLKDRELRRSPLWPRLSPEDRRKAEELYFFPLGAGSDLCGGILSTSLFPPSARKDQQLDLVLRLMGSIGGIVKQLLLMQQREHEMRFTAELLHLRSLSDHSYSSPLEMVQTYLSSVQSMLEADGATLFLPQNDGDARWKPAVRCEPGLTANLLPHWKAHELQLLEQCEPELQAYEAEALKELGIHTLMRAALLVPFLQNQQVAGFFCFARQSERPFELPQRQLAVWAAEHLGKTLVRLQSIADIKRQAQQDGLTELANRRTFDEQLDREIRVAQRAKLPCSLLLCDIDHFKAVNDTHGHQAGDEVLRVVARIFHEKALRTPAAERALTARYGGEEMAVILPGQAEVVAVRVAEEIRKAVAQESVWWQQMSIQVTISIGVATVPTHANTASDLLAVADEALYLAKASGRNRVCFAPIVSRTTPTN